MEEQLIQKENFNLKISMFSRPISVHEWALFLPFFSSRPVFGHE